MADSDDEDRLGEMFNEAETLPQLIEANNTLAIFCVYMAKLLVCYFFNRYETAIVSAKNADKYQGFALPMIIYGEYTFYYSLALLAQYPHAENAEQQEYMAVALENHKKMQQWAKHSPSNYQHKYELVEAEINRVLGQALKAMEYYDRAIRGAGEQGYIQEEALACERAAEFYLALGREKIARDYMTEAYHGYVRWGATAKVRDLKSQYPQLLGHVDSTDGTRTSSSSIVPSNGDARTLDLATVMKASLAISGELVLDKLLSLLMRLAIENAGAQKGILILAREGKLLIEASAAVDDEEVVVQQSIPVSGFQDLPATVINYVERVKEAVVLSHACREGIFTADPYIACTKLKSVLCTPILNQRKLIGIVYLENKLIDGAFTACRLELVKILSSSAAISLENALLYAEMEEKVAQRTQELNEKKYATQVTQYTI